MNKEQIEEMKSRPEFELLRRCLLEKFGNLLRLKDKSYFSDETRQVIQHLEKHGYRIVKNVPPTTG
jgi:hypothetical protein